MADTDVTQLIQNDHREVERLFQQLLSGDSGDRATLAGQLCTELKVHTQLEEQIAYPAMRIVVSDAKIDEGIQEHGEADVLIAQLEGLDVDDPAFESTLMVLQRAVQHHVEEEESEILPHFSDNTSEGRRNELGREWQRQKQSTTRAEKTAVAGHAKSDLSDATKEELYERAKKAEIPGRSKMTKAELAKALSKK